MKLINLSKIACLGLNGNDNVKIFIMKLKFQLYKITAYDLSYFDKNEYFLMLDKNNRIIIK